MTPRPLAEVRTYQNFDLLVTASGDEYHVRVLTSPVGEGATTTFAVPLSAAELHYFYTGEPPDDLNLPFGPPTPQGVGTELYDALFGDSVGECLRSSIHKIKDNEGLRIRLRIEGNAVPIADLPWEFFHAPDSGVPLLVSERIVLVRYVELPRSQAPLPVSPPLHMLVVTPDPQTIQPLQIDAEWQRLQSALQSLVEQGLVRLERLEQNTVEALQDHLRNSETHILHFIGHGRFDGEANQGSLLFEDEAGQPHWITAARFAALLQDHTSLRLVFLNACEGARGSHNDFFAGTAQTLVRQGIPAVVAMQFDVSDEAAQILAREFYEAVVDGYPVDAALAEARKALYVDGHDYEWATPVLFSRAPDNRILDLSPTAASHQAPSSTVSDSDRALFAKFLRELPSNSAEANFLKNWDMGGTIRRSAIDPFHSFLERWSNSEHEFFNIELESKRKVFHNALDSLLRELSVSVQWTGVSDHISIGISDFEHTPKRKAKREQLNHLATHAYEGHQDLIRAGRRILGS